MKKPNPINKEYTFEKGLIISSTNLNGIITYVNRKFCEIADYSKDELIGHNHNILRHPDMPNTVFNELWSTIKSGKEWTGIIKNLRKDAKYYWVYSHISPIVSEGVTIGYSVAKRPASPIEIAETTPLYAEMLAKENINE